MKARLGALIADLRAAGVAVSVAEAIDAAQAAAVVGIERAALADALAAAVVKDEGDRALFDECFARAFPPAAPRWAAARRGGARGADAEGVGSGHGRGEAAGAGGVAGADDGGASGDAADATSRRAAARAADARTGVVGTTRHERTAPGDAESERGGDARGREHAAAPRSDDAAAGRDPDGDAAAARYGTPASQRARGTSSEDDIGAAARSKAARARALRTMPFAAMSPRDIAEASALVRTLAQQVSTRLRRRLRPQPRGRLDFRRTLRAATPRGGVPLERYFRGRRPRPPALVALCDLSASVATATDFFLALLAPAAAWFRGVRLYGFVDRLVEIEFVAGQVRPAAPLDLMARSDFGRVLADLMRDAASELTRDTVLLILGDARNNRRPARADLLRDARARARRVVWLNPEPMNRWNTGDSVIDLYARHVEVVVPCGSLAELTDAVAAVAR